MPVRPAGPARRVPGRQSGGCAHGAVGQPVAAVGAEEPLLEEPVADVAVVGELGHVVDDPVLGEALDLVDASTRPWVTGSGPWYMPWRQSASMP